jgi:hypothetical protein
VLRGSKLETLLHFRSMLRSPAIRISAILFVTGLLSVVITITLWFSALSGSVEPGHCTSLLQSHYAVEGKSASKDGAVSGCCCTLACAVVVESQQVLIRPWYLLFGTHRSQPGLTLPGPCLLGTPGTFQCSSRRWAHSQQPSGQASL